MQIFNFQQCAEFSGQWSLFCPVSLFPELSLPSHSMTLGCLPLITVMGPSCVQISKNWTLTQPQPIRSFSLNVPPRYKVKEGLPSFQISSCKPISCYLNLHEGKTYVKQRNGQEKRQDTLRGRVQASFRSRCAALRLGNAYSILLLLE